MVEFLEQYSVISVLFTACTEANISLTVFMYSVSNSTFSPIILCILFKSVCVLSSLRRILFVRSQGKDLESISVSK